MTSNNLIVKRDSEEWKIDRERTFQRTQDAKMRRTELRHANMELERQQRELQNNSVHPANSRLVYREDVILLSDSDSDIGESAHRQAGPEQSAAPDRSVPPGTNALCCVCKDKHPCTAFAPCGHQCVCNTCALKIMEIEKRCPMCRQDASLVMKIFKVSE